MLGKFTKGTWEKPTVSSAKSYKGNRKGYGLQGQSDEPIVADNRDNITLFSQGALL